MESNSNHLVINYDEVNIDNDLLNLSLTNEDDFVCPIHGRASKQAEKLKRKSKRAETHAFHLLCFGKSNFERKLEEHGLRTREKKGGAVAPMASASEGIEHKDNNPAFSITELSQLTTEELTLLRRSIREKISFSNDYLSQLKTEQDRYQCGQHELKTKAVTLENTAKAVFQPWIHILPHSDEMTRALMLN